MFSRAVAVATGCCSLVAASSPLEAAKLDFLEAGHIAEAQVRATLETELGLAGNGGHEARPFSEAAIRLEDIQQRMGTMYKALPKDATGKLSPEAVRYALHRYFIQRHGWYIRGLEPRNESGQPVHNSSSTKEWIPLYLQESLELLTGNPSTDLPMLAALAAALQDLMWMESSDRLGTAYAMYARNRMSRVDRDTADSLVRTYYVAFLNSWEFIAGTQAEAEANVAGFIKDYDGWSEAKEWLAELASATLRPEGDGTFLFESVSRLASKIGEEYYVLNDKECEDLKSTLRDLQGKPGRVRLSAFYHKSMYSHWEFSEKRSYLRRLGALDESDPKHPSVIIANYVMARPNCLEASNVYAICCRNECEDLLSALEKRIEGSSATPAQLLEMVAELPSASVQAPRQLPPQLRILIEMISATHGGVVPLHGRLFAQWMHHAYPLECPYPHERGTISPLTRSEWMRESGSESSQASVGERQAHIQQDACKLNPRGGVDCEEADSPDIPWTDHEELLDTSSSGASGFLYVFLSVLGAILLGVCVLGAFFLLYAGRRRMVGGSTFRDPLE